MERRTLPIRSEYDYAPTDKDRLADLLGGFSCSQAVECEMQRCHEDRHHMIYQGRSDQPLSEAELLLKSHTDFIQRMCRSKHQQVHKTWERSEPIGDEFVVGYLISSPQNLTANKKRKLKELRRGLGR